MRVSARNGQRSDSYQSKGSDTRGMLFDPSSKDLVDRVVQKHGRGRTCNSTNKNLQCHPIHEASLRGNRAALSGALLDEPHGEGASRAQFPPSNVPVDRTHRHFSIRITGAGEQRTAIACDERATPGCGASIVGQRCTPVHPIRTNATAIRTSRSAGEWCIRFHRAWRRLRDVPLGW